MDNQCIFAKYFDKVLIETMTTAVAGIGATADSQFSGDTYAPGDYRIPKSLFGGQVIRRSGLYGNTPGKKKKQRRSRKKKR